MTKLTSKKPFLENLGSTGNVSAACAASGISRQTAYEWRNNDPDFAAAWDAKTEAGLDTLELEAQRRALESSDTLLIFLLKSKRRAVFGEKQSVEVTGANGGPIELAEVPTSAERAAELARILNSAGALPP